MDKIGYQINLMVECSVSDDLTGLQQDFLIAQDCVSKISGLFWLIKETSDFSSYVDNSKDVNVELMRSLSKLAELGFSITNQLAVVINKVEDHQVN